MTDLEALHVALQHMAAVEDQNAVNDLLYDAVRVAAHDAPLPVRKASERLRAAVPKAGNTLSLEILAAIGRLQGWGDGNENSLPAQL